MMSTLTTGLQAFAFSLSITLTVAGILQFVYVVWL